MTLREEARQALHVYQAKTGASLVQISDRMMGRLSPNSLRQFSSIARYGDGEGALTAKVLMDFFAEHPPPQPQLPDGKFYETDCTRTLDRMIAYVRRGRWGTVQGPAGAGKTRLFETRAAEAAREAEPAIAYICCSPGLTPTALLRRVGAAIGAPYAQYREGVFQSVLFALRGRRSPLALILDEAQHLQNRIETLETVRELGDVGRVGILIAGHDRVLDIFAPRWGMQFEQWRSRIEQKRVRVLGLSKAEARSIARAELGELKAEALDALVGSSTVHDAQEKTDYVSARRLFNTIRDIQLKRNAKLN